MRRLFFGIVLSLATVTLVTPSAQCCLWDAETVIHEKQFKSNYLDNQHGSPSYLPSRTLSRLLAIAIGGAGALMLAGGMVYGLVRKPSTPAAKSPEDAA